jgi:PIN domain nuclease of toxin-antitoxin system
MENVIFADTHVVVWLYIGKTELFSVAALDKIRKNELYISPVVRLELQYLYEVGRIKEKPEKIIQALIKEIGLKESDNSFIEIITEAIKHKWTRDPFDRIIAAQASLNNCVLITKDSSILSNYKLAFWD